MGVRTLKVVDNDFVFENDRLTQITGLDALAQIIGNRLKLWLNEWFAALDSGVDWFGLFNLSKNTPIEKRARIIIRQAILADSRIDKIETLDLTFNNSSRELTVDFTAIEDEEEITGTVTVS